MNYFIHKKTININLKNIFLGEKLSFVNLRWLFMTIFVTDSFNNKGVMKIKREEK